MTRIKRIYAEKAVDEAAFFYYNQSVKSASSVSSAVQSNLFTNVKVYINKSCLEHISKQLLIVSKVFQPSVRR